VGRHLGVLRPKPALGGAFVLGTGPMRTFDCQRIERRAAARRGAAASGA
jgi:hypothetical protein